MVPVMSNPYLLNEVKNKHFQALKIEKVFLLVQEKLLQLIGCIIIKKKS